MTKGIKGVLIAAILILIYLVYNSIISKVEFEEMTQARKNVVINNLKEIRTAEIAHKAVRGYYADDFDSLISFIRNDSFTVILQIGDLHDSVAVAQGLVQRDTSYIRVKDSLFTKNYPIDSIGIIPFGNGEKFRLEAGSVEKGKVHVKVFQAFAPYSAIYNGLNTKNENIDLEDGLKVGSMTETSTSGNWE